MTFTVTIGKRKFTGIEKPRVCHENSSKNRPCTILYDGSQLDNKNRVYEITGHLDYVIEKDQESSE